MMTHAKTCQERGKMQLHGGNIDQYQNCLDFSVNVNPLGPPESVKRALLQSLRYVSEYPQIGYRNLREKIAEYECASADEVICGNGAAELIYAVCQSLSPKRALLAVPTFTEYEGALKSVDCEVFRYILKKEEGFLLTKQYLEYVRALLKDKKKPEMIFLCNPNNPTGLLTDPPLLQELLQLCEENSIYLVVDECFLDFTENPEGHTLKKYLNQSNHLLILRAFTKIFAIPGVRSGYGLSANRELLAGMYSVLQPWNLSCMAVKAGIAATGERDYVKTTQRMISREREYLTHALKELGYQVCLSDTNFLLFEGPGDLFFNCVKNGILIRDCSRFEGLGKGFYRISIRLREDNEHLIRVLESIKKERQSF